MITDAFRRTKTRIGLIGSAIKLLNGIDESFLFREGNPVVILVDGDTDSGKKIIPDTAVRYVRRLLESKNKSDAVANFGGKKGHDEYNLFSAGDEKSILVSFINVAWGSDYSDIMPLVTTSDIVEENREHPTAKVFYNNIKEESGITFIHNSLVGGKGGLIDYDFKILLEKSFSEKSEDRESANKNWQRQMTIVPNPNSDLVKSPEFQKMLHHFK